MPETYLANKIQRESAALMTSFHVVQTLLHRKREAGESEIRWKRISIRSSEGRNSIRFRLWGSLADFNRKEGGGGEEEAKKSEEEDEKEENEKKMMEKKMKEKRSAECKGKNVEPGMRSFIPACAAEAERAKRSRFRIDLTQLKQLRRERTRKE